MSTLRVQVQLLLIEWSQVPSALATRREPRGCDCWECLDDLEAIWDNPGTLEQRAWCMDCLSTRDPTHDGWTPTPGCPSCAEAGRMDLTRAGSWDRLLEAI